MGFKNRIIHRGLKQCMLFITMDMMRSPKTHSRDMTQQWGYRIQWDIIHLRDGQFSEYFFIPACHGPRNEQGLLQGSPLGY